MLNTLPTLTQILIDGYRKLKEQEAARDADISGEYLPALPPVLTFGDKNFEMGVWVVKPDSTLPAAIPKSPPLVYFDEVTDFTEAHWEYIKQVARMEKEDADTQSRDGCDADAKPREAYAVLYETSPEHATGGGDDT